jgi:hypothetical protein
MKRPACSARATILGVLVSAALLAACGDRAAQQQAPAQEAPAATAPATTPAAAPATASTPASTSTTGKPCPYPPLCGDHCSNQPFVPTDCWTTPYGPAKADVVVGGVKSTNMLYCEGGTYALCFFSGPPAPTGTNPKNKPLPCVLDGDIAKCTCQAYTTGSYFVDINGILSRGVYDQTVLACGQDGSGCQNITICGPGPRGKDAKCKSLKPAPVCQYVQGQNPTDPSTSLIPKADLISTFSFAMHGDYRLGSKSCPSGLYAGCMTAPCFFEPGHKSPVTDGELVRCDCPTYAGVYQVGQANESCTIAGGGKESYVWSASNRVEASNPQ